MNTASRLFAHLRRPSLWRAACVALALLLLTSTAFAAQPLTGTFRGKVIGTYVTFTKPNKKVVTDWAGVLSLQLDRDTPGDGLGPLAPVFCIQVNVLVRGGDRYQSDGPVTALHGGCQIRYLLDHYPASTATTADEAAARQLAIWHFSDDIDLATVQEPAIQARATALADEAALAVALGGCPGAQAAIAGLTLTPPTSSVTAGQVVNYTVQADPPGAAQSVEITISGSATLENGQQQATLPLVQGLATFGVVNPVAGTSTITARLPYVLDAGTVFSPINAGRPTQRLVLGDHTSLSASATVQATWGAATPTPTSAPPTDTPIAGGPPTATPITGGSPTATPVGSLPTATPTGGAVATATPSSGGSPTATPTSGIVTATPTSASMPTPGTPGGAPIPPTATHKPSGGSKPSPTSQATPGNAPPNGSGSPPSGTPATGGTGPTPGGTGTDVPGSNTGSGNTGDTSGAGGQTSAGGAGGASQIRPSQLPNTGESGNVAPALLALAGILIACGALLVKLRRHLSR